jgi:16S rRNA (cytosine1402-N4)-methyltransferase
MTVQSEPIVYVHKPVLLKEVCELLEVDTFAHLQHEVTIVDATVGFGGHAKEFVSRGIKVIGIDTDPYALKTAEEVIKSACPPTFQKKSGFFTLVRGNFRDIVTIVNKIGATTIVGILMDVGVSSYQIDSPDRGFSFQFPDAPLDMRMSDALGVTAADLLNVLSEKQLAQIFYDVEYRFGHKLASLIVSRRKEKPFKSVADLLSVIDKIRFSTEKKVHPATLPFMALRIAVNSELETLKNVIPNAYDLLAPGGKLAIISFHSGEDRIVKDAFITLSNEYGAIIVTKKPVMASESEIRDNSRSRSAKLRVIQKPHPNRI